MKSQTLVGTFLLSLEISKADRRFPFAATYRFILQRAKKISLQKEQRWTRFCVISWDMYLSICIFQNMGCELIQLRLNHEASIAMSRSESPSSQSLTFEL